MDGTEQHTEATAPAKARRRYEDEKSGEAAEGEVLHYTNTNDGEEDVVYEDVVDIDDTMGGDDDDKTQNNLASAAFYYSSESGTAFPSHGASGSHPMKSGKRPHSEMLDQEEEDAVRPQKCHFCKKSLKARKTHLFSPFQASKHHNPPLMPPF